MGPNPNQARRIVSIRPSCQPLVCVTDCLSNAVGNVTKLLCSSSKSTRRLRKPETTRKTLAFRHWRQNCLPCKMPLKRLHSLSSYMKGKCKPEKPGWTIRNANKLKSQNTSKKKRESSFKIAPLSTSFALPGSASSREPLSSSLLDLAQTAPPLPSPKSLRIWPKVSSRLPRMSLTHPALHSVWLLRLCRKRRNFHPTKTLCDAGQTRGIFTSDMRLSSDTTHPESLYRLKRSRSTSFLRKETCTWRSKHRNRVTFPYRLGSCEARLTCQRSAPNPMMSFRPRIPTCEQRKGSENTSPVIQQVVPLVAPHRYHTRGAARNANKALTLRQL